MSLPAIVVEVSFTTNPTAVPVWVDISTYVRSVATRRGRQTELDRFEAGTCSIVLANHDRRFDPTYTGGPYYGNILPMRRIQISCTHESQTYYLFSGFVDEWVQSYRDTKIAYATVRATDGFKILALTHVTGTFDQKISSSRVNEIMAAVSWPTNQGWILDQSLLGTNTYLNPAGTLSVYTGNSSVQASVLDHASALDHLNDVTAAEDGFMFIGHGGDLIFHNRYRRVQEPAHSSVSFFSDSGGSAYGYSDIQLSYDDAQIWNHVVYSIAGSTSEQVADDTVSQATYYKRGLTKTGLLITSTSEALSAANWALHRYRDPGTRIKSITMKLINHSDGDGYVHAVLNHDIGDKHIIHRQPPGGGNQIVQTGFMEGISHNIDFTNHTWSITMNMSPAELFAGWVLDDTSNSLLGVTTYPVY